MGLILFELEKNSESWVDYLQLQKVKYMTRRRKQELIGISFLHNLRGIWDAGIKAVKNHLKRVVGNECFIDVREIVYRLSTNWGNTKLLAFDSLFQRS